MRCVAVGSFGETQQWLWQQAYCMQKWASTFQYSQLELDISLIKRPKLSGKLQGRSKLQQSYPQLQIRSFILTPSGWPAVWTPNAQYMLLEEQDALQHNDRHLSFQTVAFIPAASSIRVSKWRQNTCLSQSFFLFNAFSFLLTRATRNSFSRTAGRQITRTVTPQTIKSSDERSTSRNLRSCALHAWR